MSWDKKLKQLQEKRGLTLDSLAATLRITTRTLSDLMKPIGAVGQRDPAGSLQFLIDLLLDDADVDSVGKKPQLNLVVIHGDFKAPAGQDAVSTVIDMHAAAGKQLNNEFHYVTVEPEREKVWISEGLARRRVQPHFLVCKPGLNNQETRDCYFATTTSWLAAEAMRRDLAHITIAADPARFWSLAQELTELAEVNVTFVSESSNERDPAIEGLLDSIGIKIFDPTGRKFGVITSLRGSADPSGKISYGFISPEDKKETTLFFSWNHMHKDGSGHPEIEIDQLKVGDQVSFAIGMNNQGACATDVGFIGRKDEENPTAVVKSPIKFEAARSSKAEEAALIDILRDAVVMCADADGWALLASIGQRVNFLSDFKSRLQALKPGMKTLQFCAEYPDVFETQQHGLGSKEASARVRLRVMKS